MKKEYQVYKRHHNGKFIGWEVGYSKHSISKNGESSEIVAIATFFNPNAKEHAERFIDSVLEF